MDLGEGRRRRVPGGRRHRRGGRAFAMLLCAVVGHDGDEQADRRRHGRDHPHGLPRLLLRGRAVLPRRRVRRATTRPRSGRSPTRPCWRCPPRSSRRSSREWYPMAVHLLEGMLLGTRRSNQQVVRAGAPARARQALGRAHPRAQQPRRRGDQGHGRAARQGHRHAQQARHDRRRAHRGWSAAQARDGAGRVRQEGAPRADAVAAGDLRPRGRAVATGSTTTASRAAGTSRRSSSGAAWASRTWRPWPPRARTG